MPAPRGSLLAASPSLLQQLWCPQWQGWRDFPAASGGTQTPGQVLNKYQGEKNPVNTAESSITHTGTNQDLAAPWQNDSLHQQEP